MIERIARDARIIDITHGIAPQAVLQGALVLARRCRTMPVGVHLAVVDPGVGGDRRAVAVRTGDGRLFVGPDNGLLMLAADELGVDAAHELTNRRYHLAHVSRTFHARDVFAPAAAHLAAGVALDELGDGVDPAIARPDRAAGARGRRRSQISATVLVVDRFGNLALNVRRRAHRRARPRDRATASSCGSRSTATTPSSPRRSPTRAAAS